MKLTLLIRRNTAIAELDKTGKFDKMSTTTDEDEHRFDRSLVIRELS